MGDIQETARRSARFSRALLLSNDAAQRQRLQQAAPLPGALQLAVAETTQDALGQLRTALAARGGTGPSTC